jgi:hypothetical protein
MRSPNPHNVVVPVEWRYSMSDSNEGLELVQSERAWVKPFPTAQALVDYCVSRLGEDVGEALRQAVQREPGIALVLPLEDAGRLGIPVRGRVA